jgi:hypothetical protein
MVQELQDFLEFFHQKIVKFQIFLQKKLTKKSFGLKAKKKKLSASSPGQSTYTIKISGCCPKKSCQLASVLSFFCEKACQKILSEVFANYRTSTKRQATHTVKIS